MLLFAELISSSTEGSNFLFLGKLRTGAWVGVCWAAGWEFPLLAFPRFVGLAIVMFEGGFDDDWDRLTVPTLLITEAGIYNKNTKAKE